jgi:hypothetical protein
MPKSASMLSSGKRLNGTSSHSITFLEHRSLQKFEAILSSSFNRLAIYKPLVLSGRLLSDLSNFGMLTFLEDLKH